VKQFAHQSRLPDTVRRGGNEVAIVHYWLVGMRGGEKVVEALCELYPQADIFTHVVAPGRFPSVCGRTRSNASRSRGCAQTWYKKYLPLMPIALEQQICASTS
jgi:hypothetical protein